MFNRTQKFFVLSLLFLTGPGLVATAQAQLDHTGTWNLTTVTYLPNEDLPCDYAGQAVITQVGTTITGTAELTLTSGPATCPSEMSAKVTGVATDSGVELGLLLGGSLGEATFCSNSDKLCALPSGQPSKAAQAGNDTIEADAMSLAGPFSVTEGTYAGQTGNWSAIMVEAFSSLPVPTLAFYGALVFILMLLLIGGLSLRREPHT